MFLSILYVYSEFLTIQTRSIELLSVGCDLLDRQSAECYLLKRRCRPVTRLRSIVMAHNFEITDQDLNLHVILRRRQLYTMAFILLLEMFPF